MPGENHMVHCLALCEHLPHDFLEAGEQGHLQVRVGRPEAAVDLAPGAGCLSALADFLRGVGQIGHGVGVVVRSADEDDDDFLGADLRVPGEADHVVGCSLEFVVFGEVGLEAGVRGRVGEGVGDEG